MSPEEPAKEKEEEEKEEEEEEEEDENHLTAQNTNCTRRILHRDQG
jgi:hypothetical protein